MRTGKTFNTTYGIVEVRPAMFDVDDKTLEEGIEIKGEDIGLIELWGWRDKDELTIEDIESLIKHNNKWNY